MDSIEAAAADELDRRGRKAQELKVNVQVRTLRGFDPATEIVRLAEEESADFVVMATHGHTGLLHALLGSIAERVVRLSTRPVLTIRPEKK
jgi:nucleotide-binding universal stress UspA family protein